MYEEVTQTGVSVLRIDRKYSLIIWLFAAYDLVK